MNRKLLAVLLCCCSSGALLAEEAYQADMARYAAEAKAVAEQQRAAAEQNPNNQVVVTGKSYQDIAEAIAQRSTAIISGATPTELGVPEPSTIDTGTIGREAGARAKAAIEQALNNRAYREIRRQSDVLVQQQQKASEELANKSMDRASSEVVAGQIGRVFNETLDQKTLASVMGRGQEGTKGKKVDVGRTGIMFLSHSIPESTLIEAMQVAVENGIPAVFIGLIQGTKSIPETVLVLRALAKKAGLPNGKEPMVALDPNAFQRYGVTVVPTLVKVDEDNTINRMEGSINWPYFLEEIEKKKGYQENVGPTYKIEEISLIDEMQHRMAAIDWDKKKREALARFWGGQSMRDLPPATADEHWMIDPTVVVKRDLLNHKGELLAKAGTVINPLKTMPAQIRLLVVNPQSDIELAWANKYQAAHPYTGQTMVLGTDFSTENGWDVMQRASNTLQARIRLAPAELIDRFKLTGTPAVVQTRGELFAVEQFHLMSEADK